MDNDNKVATVAELISKIVLEAYVGRTGDDEDG